MSYFSVTSVFKRCVRLARSIPLTTVLRPSDGDADRAGAAQPVALGHHRRVHLPGKPSRRVSALAGQGQVSAGGR